MPSATDRFDARRVAFLSLVTAMAVCLSWLENLLPAPVPVIPVRLGLANVFTLLLLITGDREGACVTTVLRALIMVLVTGNVSRLAYGLAGSFLSLCGMLALDAPRRKGAVGVLGQSVAGAFLYNMGQLAAGVCFAGTAVFTYVPWMGLMSLPCGTLTGLAAQLTVRYLPASVFRRRGR